VTNVLRTSSHPHQFTEPYPRDLEIFSTATESSASVVELELSSIFFMLEHLALKSVRVVKTFTHVVTKMHQSIRAQSVCAYVARS
jgi:hypothetical protein